MQMLNWAIFSYNVNKPQTKSNDSDTCSANRPDDKLSANDFISITDLLVPMSLSLLLSLIHSQIVATSSTNLSTSDKHSKGPVHPHRKKRERKKRRKSTRSRSSLNVLVSDASKSRTNSLTEEKEAIEINVPANRRASSQPVNEASDSNFPPPRLRKRNVNWRSPIKSNYSVSDRNVQSSPEFENETAGIRDADNGNRTGTAAVAADDDGFESLNGKSSSGEEMFALNNGQAIDVNAENESTVRNNQQYTNSAYSIESFDDNDVNNNSDDDDLINGTDGITETVSRFLLNSTVRE